MSGSCDEDAFAGESWHLTAIVVGGVAAGLCVTASFEKYSTKHSFDGAFGWMSFASAYAVYASPSLGLDLSPSIDGCAA